MGREKGIAELTIPLSTAVEHPLSNRNCFVHIVVDQQFTFVGKVTMEPTDILLQGATPRDGEGEEERVKRGFIKSFTEETTCCKEDFGSGRCAETLQTGAIVFKTEATVERDHDRR